MSEPPRLLRSWRTLRSLSWRERWWLAQACALLPLLSLALRWFGFRRLYAALARLAPAPGPVVDRAASMPQALAMTGLVQAAAWHSPLHGTCLTRSLTLWWLLRRQGIPSELRIGVAKRAPRFQAHAWVEYQGTVLNDAKDVHRRFASFDSDLAPAEVWHRTRTWTAGLSKHVPPQGQRSQRE